MFLQEDRVETPVNELSRARGRRIARRNLEESPGNELLAPRSSMWNKRTRFCNEESRKSFRLLNSPTRRPQREVRGLDESQWYHRCCCCLEPPHDDLSPIKAFRMDRQRCSKEETLRATRRLSQTMSKYFLDEDTPNDACLSETRQDAPSSEPSKAQRLRSRSRTQITNPTSKVLHWRRSSERRFLSGTTRMLRVANSPGHGVSAPGIELSSVEPSCAALVDAGFDGAVVRRRGSRPGWLSSWLPRSVCGEEAAGGPSRGVPGRRSRARYAPKVTLEG
ncbi:hypothetical protein KM043_004355 [Ampulex compressa]|nr:hypothetical protein KM043_004355 [Ampulex compressa]